MRRTLAALAVTALLPAAAVAAPQLSAAFENDKGGKPARIVVTGLDQATLSACKDRKPDAWAPHAQVKVASGSADDVAQRPPLLGAWRVDGQRLIFEPRFPFLAGIPLRILIDPVGLKDPAAKGGTPVSLELSTPKKDLTPVAKVAQVYPTRTKLPENQLRFYIEFSHPMSHGESYRHIKFLDAKGKNIPDVFVEIDEELWDPTMSRFTLLFDPGRIKHGLKPREDLGPTMEAGKRYTLVVGGGWKDADGRVLTQKEFRKEIVAGPPDEEPIDVARWKLTPPAAGTRAPLSVRFPEPLDYALLHRVIWIVGPDGKKVPGKVTVSDEETLWEFRPENAWPAGKFRLVADTVLEDLAANQIGRPFEVDVFHPIPKKFETKTVEVPFPISAPPPERRK